MFKKLLHKFFKKKLCSPPKCEHPPIVDVVKIGHHYLGLCPFHVETTPSFAIWPEKKSYYCYGCGVAGNSSDVFMRMSVNDIIADANSEK